MGFNAVIASVMAARSLTARSVIDQRVKLLLPLDGSFNELSGKTGVYTVDSNYVWTSGPFANSRAWQRTQPSNQLHFSFSDQPFCSNWSFEFFWRKSDTVVDIATIGRRLLSSDRSDFYISYNNAIVFSASNAGAINTWNYYREVYYNGVGSCYCNGNRVYTYSGDAVANPSKVVLGLNNIYSRGQIAFSNVRLTTVGFNTATVAIPTTPYTGYEGLS